MLTIAYYFLQVVLCSGLMMGYYWLVLRNKRFHQYNRFYLLAIAALSWLVPLIKIKWGHTVISEDPQMMRFLSVVADNNSQIEENLSGKGFQWSWDMLAPGIYLAVALVLLFGMLRALFRIYRLLQIHSCKNVGDVYLIITEAKGTPFSFFRYIFWNDQIDIRSEAGKQILQHELTHVQQKHSFDKLFIQVMLIGGWFNPFFWLIRKEMDMIHEFIADNKAVANGDTASLAQMLLTAAYPQQKFLLTHTFFFSPIKRRLQMLTNNSSPRFSYLRRLVVLPLLAVVVVLFSFRNKEQRGNATLSVASVVENVVDNIAKNELKINNQLFNTVTSGIDTNVIVADKVTVKSDGGITEFTRNSVIKNNSFNKALIILDGKKVDRHVMEILDPSLIQSIDILKGESATATHYGEEGRNGIILITTKEFRRNKALMILDGKKVDNNILETLNPDLIKSVNVFKKDSATALYGDDGKNGVVIITTKKTGYDRQSDRPFFNRIPTGKDSANWRINDKIIGFTYKNRNLSGSKDPDSLVWVGQNQDEILVSDQPLYIVDGERPILKNGSIPTSDIIAVNVLKGKSAIDKYGKDAKNGVVEIITKKNKTAIVENAHSEERPGDQVFTKVQTSAEFPGGQTAWTKYLERNLNRDLPKEKGAPDGRYTVVIVFKVDKTGTISDINAENDPGYGTKKEAIRVIEKGPRWKPAVQNGINVDYEKKQSITFVISGSKLVEKKTSENNNHVFTKTQIIAEFPGGQLSWQKYRERNLNRDIIVEKGGPPGKYTVVVSFIVDKTGSVSDVKAENDPGYGTKEEAVRLIVKGPRWKPAMLNGETVNSVRKQPVTWVVSENSHLPR